MKKSLSLLTVMMVAALASCGSSSSLSSQAGAGVRIIDSSETWTGSAINLRFWHGFTGSDGDSMAEIVSAFNAEFNGKISVSADKLPWDTLMTKLITSATNPDTAPHIVAMGASRATGMIPKNLFVTMDDLPTLMGVKASDYVTSTWEAGTYGKENRYSFPLDCHPTALYYNKDLVSEAELPSTWSEFLTLAKSKTSGSTYGWAIPNMYSVTKDIFYSILLQNGGTLLDKDNKAAFNSDLGVAALQQLYDYKYTDKISPDSVGASGDATLFKAGKSAFYFDGSWTINTLNAIGSLNYGVAAMPGSVGDNGVSFGDSHQLGLCASTVKDNDTRSACYTFINYLSKNSQKWAEAGQVPAKLSSHETTEYKALTKLQPFTEEAAKAEAGNVDYRYFYEAYNFMGTAVADCLNGAKTAKDSLDAQATNFTKYVEEA